MTHSEIRDKFLKFFESRGHKIVPSSSLLPTDPSVLFTTAGMQQFKPYYTGQADAMKDFSSLNTVSIQKSMRTSDIDEVGDESHLTFFEMLGNFSFGGYGKEKALEFALKFLTDEEAGMSIDFNRIYATYCDDHPSFMRDLESKSILEGLSFSKDKIKGGSGKDNFWGPTGSEGPCGPTVEFYVDGIEIWNVVFNEYYSNGPREQLLQSNNYNAGLKPLNKMGIDTGMGLERLAMVLQKKGNIFETDLFSPLMNFLPKELPERIKRIIADHARSVSFLLSDGVRPSNKEAGYVLRRLLRRIFVYQYLHNLRPDTLEELMKIVFENYGDIYPELLKNRNETINAMWGEYERFNKTVGAGLKELEKIKEINGESTFKLYESFGLPYEIIKEIGAERATALTRAGFEEAFKKHQEISRAGAEKKFGGHGIKEGDLTAADAEEMKKKTRLHTATHVIVVALERVLGQKLPQAGSDITAERLRFDFTFPRKVTPEELKKAEDIANKVVSDDLPVTWKEMDLQEALKSGASAFFRQKYPPRVKVYTIGDEKHPFSRELCGGPHVSHTGEIGKITIVKEESVSGGRRIRATVN